MNDYVMNEIEGAKLTCPECACDTVYTGPLAVGSLPCDVCGHALRAHDIRARVGAPGETREGSRSDPIPASPKFR